MAGEKNPTIKEFIRRMEQVTTTGKAWRHWKKNSSIAKPITNPWRFFSSFGSSFTGTSDKCFQKEGWDLCWVGETTEIKKKVKRENHPHFSTPQSFSQASFFQPCLKMEFETQQTKNLGDM